MYHNTAPVIAQIRASIIAVWLLVGDSERQAARPRTRRRILTSLGFPNATRRYGRTASPSAADRPHGIVTAYDPLPVIRRSVSGLDHSNELK